MNDGGPAFPLEIRKEDFHLGYQQGMSLRDYFAGKAMQYLQDKVNEGESWQDHLNGVSETAYEYADAMLKARESK
jgi:hypothetical protein